jgi:hypothetical protein
MSAFQRKSTFRYRGNTTTEIPYPTIVSRKSEGYTTTEKFQRKAEVEPVQGKRRKDRTASPHPHESTEIEDHTFDAP